MITFVLWVYRRERSIIECSAVGKLKRAGWP
jgi:hypothetical protein